MNQLSTIAAGITLDAIKIEQSTCLTLVGIGNEVSVPYNVIVVFSTAPIDVAFPKLIEAMVFGTLFENPPNAPVKPERLTVVMFGDVLQETPFVTAATLGILSVAPDPPKFICPITRDEEVVIVPTAPFHMPKEVMLVATGIETLVYDPVKFIPVVTLVSAGKDIAPPPPVKDSVAAVVSALAVKLPTPAWKLICGTEVKSGKFTLPTTCEK